MCEISNSFYFLNEIADGLKPIAHPVSTWAHMCDTHCGKRANLSVPMDVRISGQRDEKKEEKNATYHCIERQEGSFSRTVTLPCDVNEDEVAAEYINGVLSVKLPKSEQAKAKRIKVRS